MTIALASPRVASGIEERLENVRHSLAEAAAREARIVCFPEAYLPGLRGLDCDVPPFPFSPTDQEQVLHTVAEWTRHYGIAAILGMEWIAQKGRHIAAVVLDNNGEIRGCQTKNQFDPTEEPLYVPENTRQLFEIDGEEGVLVQTIDPGAATGLLASRYAPERYQEYSTT